MSQGLSNPEFAARLGRSESGWSLVQNGYRRVSLDLAAAVLARAEEPWRSGFERALVEDVAEAGTAGTTPEG